MGLSVWTYFMSGSDPYETHRSLEFPSRRMPNFFADVDGSL
jgi:hypothetical protein